MALWPVAIFAVLSLLAGAYIVAICLFLVAGALMWLLQPKGKPENMTVRSVRCGDCGAIGEPHWARCPKCGAANWKPE
ncbi:MAG TPA: hypothetical protein VG456_24980 [Candidatus Sulfopaludibacter sp.]|jgi:hypothetical protein|nr:hypothetical protein [Candidatus Sulfopaludibacter sp.]